MLNMIIINSCIDSVHTCIHTAQGCDGISWGAQSTIHAYILHRDALGSLGVLSQLKILRGILGTIGETTVQHIRLKELIQLIC